MLIMAAITFPPVDLPALTTTAPTHMISAQEQLVTVWNIPVPTPLIIASPLLIVDCLSMRCENVCIARFSPTNANTVFIWDIVCATNVLIVYLEIITRSMCLLRSMDYLFDHRCGFG